MRAHRLGGRGAGHRQPRPRRRPRRSGRACRPGGRNRGSSTSKTATGPATAAASASRVGRSAWQPSRTPSPRSDSLSSHSPITLCRKRTVPSTPPSLVKSAAPACLGQHRRLELEPDQRPGAAGDVRRARSPRIGTPTTAEAVSCEPTAVTGTAGAPTRGHLGEQRADGRRRRRPAAGTASTGQAEPVEQLGVPGSRAVHVEQPGGGGVGALDAPLAGQPVGQQVRDQQQAVGGLEPGRPSADQLVDGVERQELQPVAAVQLRRVHDLRATAATPPRSAPSR